MRHVRWLVYKLGFRPKPGSIFHSPSRHLIEAFRDADMANYVIIPAAGSLVGKLPDGMTAEQSQEVVDRMVREHGARREEKK